MVDFEWYRSFIAIYKHNSVSEAAKSRIMTQPAMSQHLASLEAEVGEQLFSRAKRRLTPTERGKQLYSQLAPLIESLEEATMELKSPLPPTLKVMRVGASPAMFIERILKQLSRPDLSIISHLGTADELLELLKEDRVDLILTSKKFLSPGIEYVRFIDESFVVVAPAGTEVPNTVKLKEREQWLSEQRWISYGLELPIIRRYWREHFKKRPLINPVHIIPSLHLILCAIEEGAGLSLLPTYILEHFKQNEQRWEIVFPDMLIHNELLIGYKSKNKHSLEITEFMKTIKLV
ncbi:LysR family transcriptional regulator [Paenibacillus lutimineralis]|uniref:LysR family transcriptional regulator n=1 Tax=Paenibacillus lutimineralis TaxID=2707005 RepID=A0A3S9UZ54_9BACL|nr:LysR family transcriptional regulator [Paenibacillus lutimineralis]AZS15622.1 LysR family transcriptional regulator [Paenibacillus lutimineralis]